MVNSRDAADLSVQVERVKPGVLAQIHSEDKQEMASEIEHN